MQNFTYSVTVPAIVEHRVYVVASTQQTRVQRVLIAHCTTVGVGVAATLTDAVSE